MIIGINGPKGPRETDKAKAKSKTGATGGPSFADFLSEASAAGETAAAAPAAGVGVPVGYLPIEDDVPQNGRQQAQQLLKTLRELAEDALSGSPSAAVSKLEALASSVDESKLNAEQKAVLDEVRTRAAVEVAKLKG